MILQSTLHKDLKSISEGEYIFLGPWCLDKVPLIEPNSLKYSEDRILPLLVILLVNNCKLIIYMRNIITNALICLLEH